jgi:hypothetical protein
MMERYFTSGTGNGIKDEDVKPFRVAIHDLIGMLQQLEEVLKKGNGFTANPSVLNNWHGEYRIEYHNVKDFPFTLVNRVGFNCWGDIELGIVIPLKFVAPTIRGGNTDDMRIVLKIEVNASCMQGFIDKEEIPDEIKREVLVCAIQWYEEQLKKTAGSLAKNADVLLKSAQARLSLIKTGERYLEETTIPQLEEGHSAAVKELDRITKKLSRKGDK